MEGVQKREERAVHNKVVIVPNVAYNAFRSNSYVFSAETSGCLTLTPERKRTQPQLNSTQLAEQERAALEVPPRIKRVSWCHSCIVCE